MRILALLMVQSLVLLLPSAASAQTHPVTVTKLAPDAWCRDKDGNVREPKIQPPTSFAGYEDAGSAMIRTEDGSCYLYEREVVLSMTAPTTSAAVGDDSDLKTFGARGGKR